MDVTTILLLLLSGALITYFSGDKLASKVALIFSLGSLAVTLNLLALFTQGGNVSFMSNWIDVPKVALAFKPMGFPWQWFY